MTKKITFVATLFLIFFFICQYLNPLNQSMFNFHDDTQAARIHEFALSIKNGHIPPRLAPDFSFHLGFPVFNYYAPFAYWITTLFYLLGIPIAIALKLSFLSALFLSFFSMYLFTRLFFDYPSSLLGAIFYITSVWIPVEIFVRGNLAECWFIALFPLALYFIYTNAKSKSSLRFVSSIIVISALLTVHNIFSLISLIIIFVYIILIPNKKKSFLTFGLAILLSSYFLIPAVFEQSFIQASYVAKTTNYQDHFLCLSQLWYTPYWGYGGSAPGCELDGMSYKLGKIQIIFGVLGYLIFLYQLFKNKFNKSNNKIFLFIATLTLGALFMTLYQSKFVWATLSFILALFQFPWRLLVFGVFGLAFFSSYLASSLKIPFKSIIITAIIIVTLFISKKYFVKTPLTLTEFNQRYLSKEYLAEVVAYNMPEYLTSKANYSYWKQFEKSTKKSDRKIIFDYSSPISIWYSTLSKINPIIVINSPFKKKVKIQESAKLFVNIHYQPLWQIYINDKYFIPNNFDQLGRPIIEIQQPSEIKIVYQETLLEKIADSITIFIIVLLICLAVNQSLWNKLRTYLR